MNSDSDRLAVQLWAIGDAVRLRILKELPRGESCSNRVNVTELSTLLGISQPTISHHLRVLRQAGVIQKSKECRDCYYWVDVDQSEAIVQHLRGTLVGD
jgi:ArsR family transcriptional regulator